MLQGNTFSECLEWPSDCGDDGAGSINWLMSTVRRPLTGGDLTGARMVARGKSYIEPVGAPVSALALTQNDSDPSMRCWVVREES